MTWVAKRFYKQVEVVADEAGFAVALDGRRVRTPAGSPLALPSEALARAVASEWAAQDGTIRPETMPTMRLAATAIDRVAPRRAAVVDELLACAGTDLVCYRAAEPPDLALRQHQAWQPLIDWLAATLGAELVVTTGIMPVAQPAAAAAALRTAVEALDALELTALASAVQTAGSLVVGFALISGRIGPDAAFEAAQLDESFQIELWGEVDELSQRRRGLRDDLRTAAGFVALARGAADPAQDA